jgi:hypothetical protein
MVVVVLRHDTAAAARWTLLFIVRAFFNDTITVAVWTGFHLRLARRLSQSALNPLVAEAFAEDFKTSRT